VFFNIVVILNVYYCLTVYMQVNDLTPFPIERRRKMLQHLLPTIF